MIYLDKDSDQTICVCDRCGETQATPKANGVVLEGWLTGHLWIDLSLSEQRQTPICFCTDCRDVMIQAETIQISASSRVIPPSVEPDPNLLREKMSLTRPQLLIGLVSEQWISEEDGNLWLAGTLPAEIQAVIATLPANQQFAARARAMTATIFPRLEPLVRALAQIRGKTDEEMDAFFTTWAQV